jgi:hypothetical protein
MITGFVEVFDVLNLQIILLAALLFFVGYALAPTAYFKQIKWLTAYPFFIIHLMDKYFKKEWSPPIIFVVIFLLNSISLFVNLLSGWGIILPYGVIIYMGINIGVIMYHSLEGRYYYASLFNPVAILELPAAWLSIAMAIQFSLGNTFNIVQFGNISFETYVRYFIQTIIPILILAAFIETLLIMVARKQEEKQD